ncbi:MAG: NADH-quinone oxidoreductase subunit NuoD [Actinobacteria bacterium QS_5_72_10]|nr:MAG: NADH-quinone oxidoreductase subunit NuoD [Actinobacteria bacterium QS_8_72_14]PSO52776.1 MAG: NADH-quinone oxidoreductase subunit NuoD [Actinobacteria bacterium QS_5_72_10]
MRLEVRDEEQGGLQTQEMNLNIGPQHPATHGVLRVVLDLDGERIARAEPVIGYMHRGFEKLAEHRDYRQIIALVNRHDWLSAFCNEIGVALAVETMMELEVPERAQWIRTLLCEWNRIMNHLMFVGSFGLELGALTPVFYAFREREEIQHLMESATGGRLHFTFCRVGGLKDDLPLGFLKASEQLVPVIRQRVQDYRDLLLGNEIFQARTSGVGKLPAEVALDYGVSGPALHATGVAEDARVTEPYAKYADVDVRVPTGETGDSYDRFRVLLDRIDASLDIVAQCLDNMPSGPVNVKLPKQVKAPEGAVYVRTENPLGQGGYYLVSDGKKYPWRLKMRTPSFSNISMLPYLLEGELLPNMIAILGSVYFVVGDIDR